MKILIVDDEKLLVKGIKFNFEQEGYQVETAYDGEEALKLVRDKSIDIIILDLMLPKVDGLSVEFNNWRFNLRMSNTEPVIRLNVETKGDEKLLKEKTDELLAKIRA